MQTHINDLNMTQRYCAHQQRKQTIKQLPKFQVDPHRAVITNQPYYPVNILSSAKVEIYCLIIITRREMKLTVKAEL